MDKQICNKCFKDKDITDFEWQKNRPNPRKTCNKCRNKLRVITPKEREKRRLYAIKQKADEAYSTYERNLRLIRTYGITQEYYLGMYEEQQGCCDICKEPFIIHSKVHIDHNHATGKVRSLLCANCNLGIGNLKENKEILLNAIKYLEKHQG